MFQMGGMRGSLLSDGENTDRAYKIILIYSLPITDVSRDGLLVRTPAWDINSDFDCKAICDSVPDMIFHLFLGTDSFFVVSNLVLPLAEQLLALAPEQVLTL